MKQKIGTLIEEDVMRQTKRRAADEGRSISEVIQDALVDYLQKDKVAPKERRRAYHEFCEHPMRIPKKELVHLLDDDIWGL